MAQLDAHPTGDNVLRLDIADMSDHCLSFRCRHWLFGFVNGRLTGMEHCAQHTRVEHVATGLEREEIASSTPTEVGNILLRRLIMKYFLQSFSPFR